MQVRALAINRRVLGEEHRDTLTSLTNMGALLMDQGKLSEAEPYWREALAKRRRVLGEDDLDTLNAINNMGGLLYEQRKLSEVEPYWREALAKRRRLLGEEHPRTLNSISNMGFCCRNRASWASRSLTAARRWRSVVVCSARSTRTRWVP